MGYYCAWGDAKVMCSSEEEGYENRISDDGEKREGRIPGTHGEAPPTLTPPISDDTDRQFWAEDELSSTESRQRLATRRKRRHSVSYRNRAANRSRSCIPRPSNSSSDSIHAGTSPKVRRTRIRWLNPKTEKLQSEKTSCTSIEETVCTVNKVMSSEHQAASTSGLRLEARETIASHVKIVKQHERANIKSRKIRVNRLRGPSNCKSKQK